MYFQDSTDVQRQAPTGIDTNGDGVADTVVTLIRNISAQETIGGELEANFAFDNGFSVGAWYSYVNVDVTEGLQAGEAEMRGIPQNQAGLDLTYRRELTGKGSAYASANFTYQSDVDLDDFDGVYAHEDAYTLAKIPSRRGRNQRHWIGGRAFHQQRVRRTLSRWSARPDPRDWILVECLRRAQELRSRTVL